MSVLVFCTVQWKDRFCEAHQCVSKNVNFTTLPVSISHGPSELKSHVCTYDIPTRVGDGLWPRALPHCSALWTGSSIGHHKLWWPTTTVCCQISVAHYTSQPGIRLVHTLPCCDALNHMEGTFSIAPKSVVLGQVLGRGSPGVTVYEADLLLQGSCIKARFLKSSGVIRNSKQIDSCEFSACRLQ